MREKKCTAAIAVGERSENRRETTLLTPKSVKTDGEEDLEVPEQRFSYSPG